MPTQKKGKQKSPATKRIKSETKEEADSTPNAEIKAEIKTDIKFDEKTGLANMDTFERQYALIKEMRSAKNAPVDSMGCSKLFESEQSESEKRYQVLLSLMLSSQTKDEVTAKAMQNLAKHGATMQNIDENTSEETLADLIYPVSFYKRKAKYIKNTTKVLIEKYKSDIPASVEELMKLPGVGPKMAYLCMSHAWNNTVGIGVDVHVNRISNRIGWAKTKTPEQTRKQLEEYVPKELWSDVNEMLVGFGQTICKPVGPKCGSCKLMENNLCIYYAEHVATKPKKPSKKKQKQEVKEEAEIKEGSTKVKLEENQSSSELIADIESMFGEDFSPRRSPRKRKPVSYADVKDEKV